MRTLVQLRAAYHTARRAGVRRCLRRFERILRLQLLNPQLGSVLYPLCPPNLEVDITQAQLMTLQRLVHLRRSSPSAGAWDPANETLSLLNQPPVSLKAPMGWDMQPIDDALWSFRLHSWEWAWPALGNMSSREVLLALWHDWVERVPVGRGHGWQPYPTSRRLVVWSAAWCLLDGDETLLTSIAQQAAYLADNLECDLDNNHLVANAKALAWVGLLFSGLHQAASWREQGLDLLWDALDAQVRADGGHVENSTSYHLSVWLDGLETALLCRASDEPVSEEVWETLRRMGEFALALRRPDGRLPLLNDSIEDEPLPAGTLFALASSVLDCQDLRWGADRADAFEPAFNNKVFEGSGYAVLRSGWGSDDTYLVFDVGDLGPRHCPGHGHADALSVELWGRGEPLILDPGTYQYPVGQWRDYFRGTAAHTTAQVDGIDQSSFVGPFRVADMAHTRLISVSLDHSDPMIVGEHDGYTRLSDPVVHRRGVCLRSPDHLMIEDVFFGSARHRVDIRFHLAPCEVELLERRLGVARYPGGTELILRIEGVEGMFKVEKGWISRTWYRKESSPVLSFEFQSRLPATVTTSLLIR